MDLVKAYSELIKIAMSYPSIPQYGIGGMWTPDDEKKSEHLIFRTYAGGYQHQLISTTFGFELTESYTNKDGSVIKLSRGTVENVQKCLDHFKLDLA